MEELENKGMTEVVTNEIGPIIINKIDQLNAQKAEEVEEDTKKAYDEKVSMLEMGHKIKVKADHGAIPKVKKKKENGAISENQTVTPETLKAATEENINESKEENNIPKSISTPEEIAEELKNIFPTFPPEILLDTARKYGTFGNAATELFNFVPEADFLNKPEDINSFSNDENNNVKERVAKSLLLLKDNDIFKKVTLTEKRDFNLDDPLENKFRLAKGHYLSVSGQFASPIESIDYVENRTLMEVFERKKNQLKSEGKDAKEYLLFHGTDNVNIDSILKQNFQMDYAGRNGQVYGRGIYFSEKTIIPNKYMVGTKKTLLLCRVLLGREFSSEFSLFRNSDIPDGFNSKSVQHDGDNRASINVIKEVDQILPCFVLNLAAGPGDTSNNRSAANVASFVASTIPNTVFGPFQPGTISTCPYDASHQIPQDMMQYHLSTCRKRHFFGIWERRK